HAALILLGDKDQLASVAPGSVLADLCKGSQPSKLSVNTSDYVKALTGFTPGSDGFLQDHSMANSLCLLRKSYRFDELSPIGIAAREINVGNYKGLQHFWCDDSEPKTDQGDVCFYPSGSKHSKAVMQDIVERYRDFVKACQQGGGENAAELLKKFTAFQVLCATRDGPQSVEFINQMVESALFKQGAIPVDGWYAGCPVMITENNYGHRLFNGDVGIVLRDVDEGKGLKVFFPADLAEGDARPRAFSTRRLPAFSKVFAMTVHKSQGSEFDEIVFVLPDRDSSVLTRELVYTGVTRAKRVCRVLVNKGVLRGAVKRRVLRDSGLEFS
ncbi:MAG: ATP-binding domain-containing protein, partial [Gammaproteobacteria bacterium]|nr:ATP-binding domain-containing protein [Gammaproteobacteria bacterium]